MTEHILIGIASIIVLGIGAQWLAWRLKFPSILFLLILGFVAGPIMGFLKPDELLGPMLLPVVSISVAVILFEGGLSLKIAELREVGKVVRNLITTGALTTWILVALAAYFILNLNLQISVLLGAIMIVTGPTVIVPLLRQVRPTGRVAKAVKWEGIMIDPVGALLAVLVFEAILHGTFARAGSVILVGVLKTVFFGSVIGIVGAGLLVLLLKHYWIPDYLQETVTLMLVIVAFVGSNLLQAESGLFTVTLMGIVLTNQKQVPVKHIVEFKENLRVVIISSLFILLAARLELDVLDYINSASFIFVLILMLVVRPLAVFLSTWRSELNWRQKAFISWMAPRGIVAAAVASLFALDLAEANVAQAEYLVPITFLVIVVTVAVYGLSASWVARWLKVSNVNPQGALIIGAHAWAREMARALQSEKFKVLLVDTNRYNEFTARMEGFPTYHGSVLSEYILEDIELDGIGRLLALTSNDEANSLAALHFMELFDSSEVYQLPPEDLEDEEFSPQHLRGRFLFGNHVNHAFLSGRFEEGAIIKKTRLTEDFDYGKFEDFYGESAVPLFLIDEDKRLKIFTVKNELEPEPGQTLISLVDAVEEGEVQEKSERGANAAIEDGS